MPKVIEGRQQEEADPVRRTQRGHAGRNRAERLSQETEGLDRGSGACGSQP